MTWVQRNNMMLRLAITREISRKIGYCELSFLPRAPIDVDLARAQHRLYEESLSSLGCSILRLPEEPDLPDSVFVEDVAIVLDEAAVITRPGAASRRPEIDGVEQALRSYRTLLHIEAPGTLDGGDVLPIGKRVYVGQSRRSNPEGIRQLRSLLSGFGYEIVSVPLTGCLHLKSAVSQVAHDAILINPALVDPGVFPSIRHIDVAPDEPEAANALRIGDTVIHPDSYPATRARLETQGIRVITVPASELAKAEGGVTCCSLILETTH
jgi:dimethylargininase